MSTSSCSVSGIAASVTLVERAGKAVEGGGFTVRRPVGEHTLLKCDPILMLDHFGPTKYGPGEAVGAPDHPHRGQVTVTYLIQGSTQHLDSFGHKGDLKPGDVQWMVAGRGLVHSEMPSEEIFENGGTIEGFQLWINLPKKDKMTKPKYQEIPSQNVPEYVEYEEDSSTQIAAKTSNEEEKQAPSSTETVSSRDDKAAPEKKVNIKVRVIAGETNGVRAKIYTNTPIIFYDIQINKKGASFTQPITKSFNTFIYVYRGEGLFGDNINSSSRSQAKEGDFLLLSKGDYVTVTNTSNAPLRCVLLGGEPINEPIKWTGPFVMNTDEDIRTAIRDFQAGKMGFIAGSEERQEKTRMAQRKAQKKR